MREPVGDIPQAKKKAFRFATSLFADITIDDVSYKSALIQAFSSVPRELFVEQGFLPRAYEDLALPIGYGQTISRPSTVARMLATAQVLPTDRVLEIGAGSGYLTALLSFLCHSVYAVEASGPLAQCARDRLDLLGLQKILLRKGDGLRGWKEQSPFDVIIASAAFPNIPEILIEQLKPVTGRIVMPVIIGPEQQELLLYSGGKTQSVGECFFVPGKWIVK